MDSVSYFYGPLEPKRRHFSAVFVALVVLVALLAGGVGFALLAPDAWVASVRGIRNPQPITITPVHASPVPAGGEWPVVAVAEKVGPSVVGIEAEVYYWGWSRETKGGSGVILSQDGYIVTNHHVIEGAREITVLLPDKRKVPARLVGSDALYDLAVLKVDVLGLRAAEFGDSDALKVGELAVAIGNPVGPAFERTVTAGIISGLNRAVQLEDQDGMEYILELIQTDAAINPGNSGGPLCNARGEVIGINTIKVIVPNVEGMGLAIPSKTVLRVVNELMQYGRVIRPRLGVVLYDPRAVAVPKGVPVQEVDPRGPAAIAGIRPGDIILALGDREVNSLAEFRAALYEHRPGDKLKVVVQRQNRRLEFAVTLVEAP
ncbi:MAG: trypsin-like peptidase domain-containing protein [Bacillota bacterium]